MNPLCRNNISQIVEACLCPINRYATMVEHSCDEYELFRHPDWLIMHYIENGGAKKHAELRNKAEKETKNE